MKANLGIIVTLVLAIMGGTLEFGAMRQQAKDDRDSIVELKVEVKELRGRVSEMPIVLQSWARSMAAEMQRTSK